MAIGDDFEIQNDGDIRHVSGSATYTVLELHRWLQGLADDQAAASDDFMDITKSTPSERSTDNIITLNSPFNIDDTAAEYLYNGSITQAGGATIYAGLVVVGAVESGTQLQITQDNAVLTSYWGTGLNADAAASILLRIMVKVRVNGADIDGKRFRVWARELSDKYAEFSVSAGLGNNTAAIFTSNDLNNQTSGGTISGWTITNTEGLRLIDVNNDGSSEEYYSEWDPGSQSINDLYEYTKYITRRGTASSLYGMNGALFRGVSHSFAYDGESGGPFTQGEVIVWGMSFNYDNEGGGGAAFTVGEYVSFSSGGVGKLIQLTDAGTTGSMVVAKEAGTTTPADNDTITGLTTGRTALINGSVTGGSVVGGEAAILARDDDGTTGNLYVQLLSGVAPVDNDPIRGRTSGCTALVNGSVTSRTISPEFIGSSTGSALIGAYGVGVKATELSASDLVFDLSNTSRTPPNYVTFTVGGVVSGEDYVLVGPADGSSLDVDQMTLNGALTGGTVTSVVVNGSIPADTPATGTIRILRANGAYTRHPYSAWTGSTFTITSHDFSSNNAANGANTFVSYIDTLADATSEAFTSVYSSNRSLFVRVRDGGGTPIKTFETTGTLTSTGGSVTAIRTSDS